MFDHNDESRGFWDDEPTRPLERFSARLKPAGAPPPQPTRLWPSRANQPAGRHHADTQQLPVVSRGPGRSTVVTPRTSRFGLPARPAQPSALYDVDLDDDFGFDDSTHTDEYAPRPNHDVSFDEFDEFDGAFDQFEVVPPVMRRHERDTSYLSEDTTQHAVPRDRDWPPASVSEAVIVLVRRGRDFVDGMDPVKRRLGAMVLTVLLLIPIVLALRGGDSHSEGIKPDTSTVAVGETAAPEISAAPLVAAVPAAQLAQPAAAPTQTTAQHSSPAKAAAVSCSQQYTIASGDYWISIAKRAGVSTKDLLAANNATTKSLLLPGKAICLPKGATVPAPTTAAPTTAAPAAPAAALTKAAAVACTKKYTVVSGDAWSVIASRTKVTMTQLLAANNATTKTVLLPGKSICLPANATVSAPKPATAPATTTPKASTGIVKTRAYTQAEVQKIIRDIWPDELEEWALKQAWKESNWQNNVYNSCCYGLFQINFNAHKSWMAKYGVTNASQLLDPVVNTNMAVAVYRRMGGTGPWTTPMP